MSEILEAGEQREKQRESSPVRDPVDREIGLVTTSDTASRASGGVSGVRPRTARHSRRVERPKASVTSSRLPVNFDGSSIRVHHESWWERFFGNITAIGILVVVVFLMAEFVFLVAEGLWSGASPLTDTWPASGMPLWFYWFSS